MVKYQIIMQMVPKNKQSPKTEIVLFGMIVNSGLIYNHGVAVHIINFEEIVYHQNEVLYIIIVKAYSLSVMICSLTADGMHPSGDNIPLLSQWIKKTILWNRLFGTIVNNGFKKKLFI
ncbi:MAG: hypothetical protein IJE48_00880 [Clostridia bacterium]|nr:hypothetical protein [Clostridia bacterium]